ncbi:MAG: pilus assembly protein PilC [Gammaproteobacteria bacterium]|nr:pilus assembly protein PilC [Gammaproteobacteria bacterium]
MKSLSCYLSLSYLILFSQISMAGFTIADIPLFLNQSVNPRVMLTMSNDHQLFIKAYTDYSDLDGDGTLDTSYVDTVEYSGYFNSNMCYDYSVSDDRFNPATLATGTNNHFCNEGGGNRWSGNFLNWATMTRMDIIRKVLYGGYRSTDNGTTVLQRAMLPYDVHAFAKVFNPGSPGETNQLTPYSESAITMCNFTHGIGLSRDLDTASYPPVIRVANGAWPRWAASEVKQCQWGSGTRPSSTDSLEFADLSVRVNVCHKTATEDFREANCSTYPNGNIKPTGILQHYGEDSTSRPILFGLMTGSYQKNKSGGVLRKNIGKLSGNDAANASQNEIDSNSGVFINQGATDEGIINTMNRLRISSYDFGSQKYQNSCHSPGIPDFDDGECVDWGNPLSEIYLETLRYLAGKASPTTAFNADDSDFIISLPQVSWKDPMPAEDWCADTSVIAISTGLNSFDTDQLSNDLGINVNSITDVVGSLEGINDSYLIGSNGTTDDGQCTGKPLSGLGSASGICPEVPSTKGGYGIAGLAFHAHTEDLRSDRDEEQNVFTYSIALAESLPKFEIPVGDGTITILPACEANSSGSASLTSSGWRNCSMTDLIVENLGYTAGQLSSGRFLVNWEDSTWGNDYDMDGIERLEFCVGSACSPAVSSNEINVTTTAAQANAGHALRFGFTVTGSQTDGVILPVLRPGGRNFNLGSAAPWGVTPPVTTTLTAGTSSARLLKNPLWYAAKYGGFIESDNKNNPQPNLATEWDADSDGLPDAFFAATNPAKLGAALNDVLNDVVSRISSASSVATNSTRLDTNTLIYQARFNSGDWSGEVLAYPVNPGGSIASSTWDAGELVPLETNRKIFTYDSANATGIEFEWSTLTPAQQTALGTEDMVSYLRGDQSQEQQNGGTFRNRSRLLGDVVNSDPWFVGHENFGYENLPNFADANGNPDPDAEGPAYRTFIDSSTYTNRRRMLYVGSNDGMLHGFDATTGVEQFAYIPDFLISELPQLARSNYVHRYYVDGSPRAAAANFGTTSSAQWKTVLMGSAGAGGRGVFALDITNPDTFSASNVLWEFDNADDADLGYTFGQPTIVRLPTGQWAAIVANGYNSDSHKAILFILDITDGSVIAKLDTGIGDGSTPNGLSTAIPVDTDNDYTADVIYAGDMLGNLWKFDVSDKNANQWEIAFKQGQNPRPLYVACNEDPCVNRQSITGKPQVGRHPDAGVMVYFGTGQYFETGDNQVTANPQINTYYGIWDNGAQVEGRDNLQVQTIISETGFQGNTFRVTSDTEVNYGSGNNGKQGWYMDLVAPSPALPDGERVTTRSLLRHGRIIFTTLIPSPDRCSFGGTSWLMELDAVNGSGLADSPIDINHDNDINKDDVLYTTDTNGDGTTDSDDDGVDVSGVQSSIGIIKSPGVISSGDKEYKYTSGSSGHLDVITESNDGLHGRLSWRELR